MIIIGFAVTLLVPAVMILWGRRLKKEPPEYLQGKLSFRTKRARKDEDIWNYANSFFSHMILISGINCGLVSVVFYTGAAFLKDGRYWAAASLSLFCVQAVCVLLIYRITDFIIGKTYGSGIVEEEDGEAVGQTDDSENR